MAENVSLTGQRKAVPLVVTSKAAAAVPRLEVITRAARAARAVSVQAAEVAAAPETTLKHPVPAVMVAMV